MGLPRRLVGSPWYCTVLQCPSLGAQVKAMIQPRFLKRIAKSAHSGALFVLGAIALTGCGGQIDTAGGTTSSASGGTSAVGGTAVMGGTAATGGTASVGGSTSTIDVRACLADSDCTPCVYVTAPSNSGECANTLGCCGGQVMNQETCNWNQGAWEANCSGQGYTIPDCMCLSPCAGASCTLGCKNGECGFW